MSKNIDKLGVGKTGIHLNVSQALPLTEGKRPEWLLPNILLIISSHIIL